MTATGKEFRTMTFKSLRPALAIVFGAVVTGVLAASIAWPGTSTAGHAVQCGSIRFNYIERGTRQYVQAGGISAVRLSCRNARRLGYTFAKARRDYVTLTRIGSFRCSYERFGSDIGLGRCWLPGGAHRTQFGIYDSSPYH